MIEDTAHPHHAPSLWLVRPHRGTLVWDIWAVSCSHGRCFVSVFWRNLRFISQRNIRNTENLGDKIVS